MLKLSTGPCVSVKPTAHQKYKLAVGINQQEIGSAARRLAGLGECCGAAADRRQRGGGPILAAGRRGVAGLTDS